MNYFQNPKVRLKQGTAPHAGRSEDNQADLRALLARDRQPPHATPVGPARPVVVVCSNKVGAAAGALPFRGNRTPRQRPASALENQSI